MLFPSALPKLMPLFVGKGNRGHQRYLKQLETRGIARVVNGQWELSD